MPGKIIRADNITRLQVRAGYGLRYYVFGDNMERRGLGGQAGVMRGEPNAIGVPTKWSPSNRPDAYFTDEDWGEGDVERAVYGAFATIEARLKGGVRCGYPFRWHRDRISRLADEGTQDIRLYYTSNWVFRVRVW